MSDIVESLNELFVYASGRSINRGCADCGLAANTAMEAASTITALQERVKVLESIVRGYMDLTVAPTPCGIKCTVCNCGWKEWADQDIALQWRARTALGEEQTP